VRWRRTVEYVPAPVPRRPRDNPWLWLGLLAALVVALLIVVLALAARDDDEGRAEQRAVPNLVGLDQADAGQRAEALGLVPDTFGVPSESPFGQIVQQEPQAGVTAPTGSHVRLNASLGTEERPAVLVPDLVGTPAPEAREALRRLALAVLTQEADGPRGRVVAQTPAAGTEVPPLTQVTLTVGR
jgi:serine/threonine-protein kinase